MGYSLVVYTADGRRWVATRGRRLSVETKSAMYYPHPSAARAAATGLLRKLFGGLKPQRVHMVRSSEVVVMWNCPQLLPPSLNL